MLLKEKPFLAVLLFFLVVFPIKSNDTVKPIGFIEAARMAVDSSDDLKTEFAMQAVREGAWRLGLRAYLPVLSFNAAEDDRLSEIGQDTFQKTYTVNMEQFLFDGGRTSTTWAIEKAELSIMSTELERRILSVADAALTAYRSVLSARTMLDIREAVLLSLIEQRRILSEEVNMGLALEADLIEADISVSEANIEILSLKIQLEEAEQQLAEGLGVKILPPLAEKVDIYRRPVLPVNGSVRSAAQARNPELISAQHAITKRRVEARYAAMSWIPTLRMTAGVSITGRKYPLNRASWSVGLVVDFSSPWFNSRLGGSYGWEPPYEKTARTQGTITPLPDPASGLTAKNSELALALETIKYDLAFERIGRNVEMALEKCYLTERKRELAVDSLSLASERLKLSELRLQLGQITRIDLMDAEVKYAQREIEAVEIAIALLQAERELEAMMDLPPGGLENFVSQQLRLGR
ncbi:MAG: TolC family protein [Treponema sp.]|nr:TolC family protein [Treponema sp.]